MVFLVPGVVAQPLPASFANPAAYGDLATGLLAVVALVLLQRGATRAVPLVWVFNTVGSLDLLNALRHVDVATLRRCMARADVSRAAPAGLARDGLLAAAQNSAPGQSVDCGLCSRRHRLQSFRASGC